MNNLVANVVDGVAATDPKCAGQPTYEAIKKSIFDAAKKKVTTNPALLNSLASHSIIRMTSPLVRASNPQIGRTECSGLLTLVLPAAASNAFGGSTELSADVQYAVQPAADKSGVVVEATGTGTISDQLAVATDTLNQRKSGATGFGGDTVGGSVTAFAGKTYNPSFDCGGRLTNAMRMICQDSDLASADRDMNALYSQKKAATPKPDLPALIAAQRAFLKSRDNCPDTACMSDLYAQRSDVLNMGE